MKEPSYSDGDLGVLAITDAELEQWSERNHVMTVWLESQNYWSAHVGGVQGFGPTRLSAVRRLIFNQRRRSAPPLRPPTRAQQLREKRRADPNNPAYWTDKQRRRAIRDARPPAAPPRPPDNSIVPPWEGPSDWDTSGEMIRPTARSRLMGRADEVLQLMLEGVSTQGIAFRLRFPHDEVVAVVAWVEQTHWNKQVIGDD